MIFLLLFFLTEKVMVKPTSCPSDIAKLGSTRITPVTWTAPTFSGVVDNVKSTYSSGKSTGRFFI